jgi:hypothetical protein
MCSRHTTTKVDVSNANNCRGNKTYSLFDAFKRVVMRRDNTEAKQEQMRALIEKLYV